MRILGLTDIIQFRERMEKGIKDTFPGAEARFLQWPPENVSVMQQENLNIEQNGVEAGTPPPGILEIIKAFDPEIIITHFTPVTRAVIEKAKSLKVIGTLRSGMENVNVEAATAKKIFVLNNAGRAANAVAEFTVGLMLSASRSTSRAYYYLVNGEWWRPPEVASEITGCTIGLVGFGNIAQKVAGLLQGFKVNLLVYDPYISKDILDKYRGKQVELKELLSKSDIVSLHARLDTESQGLINEAEFKLMKPTAYLINTARAGLINETALRRALEKRHIKGVALDVFWQEPLSQADPLLKLDNVLLTPHLAGSTAQTRLCTISLMMENLLEFLKMHQSQSVVNFSINEQIKLAGTMKLS